MIINRRRVAHRFRVGGGSGSVADPRVRYAVRPGIGDPAQYCDCSGSTSPDLLSDHWTVRLYAAQYLVLLCANFCYKQKSYSAKNHHKHAQVIRGEEERIDALQKEIKLELPNVQQRSSFTTASTTSTTTTTTTTMKSEESPIAIFENYLLRFRSPQSRKSPTGSDQKPKANDLRINSNDLRMNSIEDSNEEEDRMTGIRVKKSRGW